MNVAVFAFQPVRDFAAIHIADLREDARIARAQGIKNPARRGHAAGHGQISGDNDAFGLGQAGNGVETRRGVVQIAHDDPVGGNGAGRVGMIARGGCAWHHGGFLVMLLRKRFPAARTRKKARFRAGRRTLSY